MTTPRPTPLELEKSKIQQRSLKHIWLSIPTALGFMALGFAGDTPTLLSAIAASSGMMLQGIALGKLSQKHQQDGKDSSPLYTLTDQIAEQRQRALLSGDAPTDQELYLLASQQDQLLGKHVTPTLQRQALQAQICMMLHDVAQTHPALAAKAFKDAPDFLKAGDAPISLGHEFFHRDALAVYRDKLLQQDAFATAHHKRLEGAFPKRSYKYLPQIKTTVGAAPLLLLGLSPLLAISPTAILASSVISGLTNLVLTGHSLRRNYLFKPKSQLAAHQKAYQGKMRRLPQLQR